ncbi:DNA repair protein Rad21 [Entamoeba marina]
MFYSQVVLTKKGPLAKVWIAAHWEGKLTKHQILTVDLKEAVNAVANPEIPIALRISGHLLLGICRIYSRKVRYLLQDCNDALVKIKLSFRPGAVDAEKAVAAHGAITLPPRQKDFSDDNEQLNAADLKELTGNFTANARDITLPQEIGGLVGMGSMDEIPLNTLDELLSDPGVLRAPESMVQPSVDLQPLDKTLLDSTMHNLMSAVSNEEMPHDISEKPVSLMEETDNLTLGDGGDDANIDLPNEEHVEEKTAEEGDKPEKKKRKEKKVIYDRATVINKNKYKKNAKNVDNLLREFDLAPGSLFEIREEGRKFKGRWENVNEKIRTFVKNINVNEVVDGDIPLDADDNNDLLGALDIMEKSGPHKRNISDDHSLSSEEKRKFEQFDEQPLPIPDDVPEFGLQPMDMATTTDFEDKQKSKTVSWTSRSAKVHNFLKKSMGDNKEISYKAFVQGKKRKQVVGVFFELLVLKTQGVIDLEQQTPYGDVVVKQTDTFLTDVETTTI